MSTRSVTPGAAPLASRLALTGSTAGLLIGGAHDSLIGGLLGAVLGFAMSRVERAGPLQSFLLAIVCIVSTLFASQAAAWSMPCALTPVAIFAVPLGGLLAATLLERRARPGTPVHAAFGRAGWSAIALSASLLAAVEPTSDSAPLVATVAVLALAMILFLDGRALVAVARRRVADYGVGNDLRPTLVACPDGGPYRSAPPTEVLVGNRTRALCALFSLVVIDAILLAVSLVLRFRFIPSVVA